MKILEKTPDLVQRLQEMEIFRPIDTNAIQWLVDRSEYRLYETGEFLFVPEQKADYMIILLQGDYLVEIMYGDNKEEFKNFNKTTVTGVLPFSRMTHNKAYGRCLTDCSLLALHKNCFTEMVNVSYELTQALVGEMTSRVRTFTTMRTQTEKLMSLGKLSAGLAHELNNPAAAIVRSADELYNQVHKTPEKFKAIMTMRVTPEETDAINEILFAKIANVDGVDLSLLEREERKDDMTDWFEDQGIEQAEEIADTFVDFGFTLEDLEKIEEVSTQDDIAPIMGWLESTLRLERLVNEIKEASGRISSLVKAVKEYSHMDRSTAKEATDIHRGIKSTMIMLKHKFKQKQIQVVKNFDFELPQLKAHVGQLNQVWTNIIVNALDAMDKGGTLKVSTNLDTTKRYICVDISNNGPQIPEDKINCIFDPFFTTKALDEGTGMGLDIVKKILDRHNGTIDVESDPDWTTFSLCFPLN